MRAKLADALGRERTLGPAPWFVFSGPLVKRGPEGHVVAEHADAFWVRDEQRFHELSFVEPARVVFEAGGGKRAVGPFECVSAHDGALYGDGQLLARLLPSEARWMLAQPAVVTRELVIEPFAAQLSPSNDSLS